MFDLIPLLDPVMALKGMFDFPFFFFFYFEMILSEVINPSSAE